MAWWKQPSWGYRNGPKTSKNYSGSSQGPFLKADFALINGKLLHKNRLVISAHSPWISKLLEEFHNTLIRGHSGFYRTYRRIASQLYWCGMTKSIKQFIRSCDTCQRYKSSTLYPNGLLQPLPIPNRVWEDISLDFITGLPKSKGYKVILVVVDCLSKYCHFIPLELPFLCSDSCWGVFTRNYPTPRSSKNCS